MLKIKWKTLGVDSELELEVAVEVDFPLVYIFYFFVVCGAREF